MAALSLKSGLNRLSSYNMMSWPLAIKPYSFLKKKAQPKGCVFFIFCFQAEEGRINRVANLKSSGTGKNRIRNQKEDW